MSSARPTTAVAVEVWRDAKTVFSAPLQQLHQAWDEVSWRISAQRDNPACADSEHAAAGAPDDTGLHVALSFDASEDVAAPFIAKARPKVAILREQGVNSHVEMSYAMAQAGFDTFDVHMSDLQAGRARLEQFHGLVACGGFSYGDTLGAGEGWARSMLFNPRAGRAVPSLLPAPGHLRAGRVQRLPDDGRAQPDHPGRAGLAEVHPQPERAVRGPPVAGRDPREPVDLLPGHGRQPPADRRRPRRRLRGLLAARRCGQGHRAMRFVDSAGRPTEAYPANPNGSPDGLTSVTTADGRFTVHDAAPGAGVPQRADELDHRARCRARQPLDAHVPQRAPLGRLTLEKKKPACLRACGWGTSA